MRGLHTPGPWSVWPSEDGVVVTDDKLARHIAKISMGTPHWQEDAHLIATAPDLLAALISVVSIADRDTTEFRAAHAAIAKAQGKEVSA